MGKMKAYMMDLEEKCFEALEFGAVNDEDVYLYVAQYLNTSRKDVCGIMDIMSKKLGNDDR